MSEREFIFESKSPICHIDAVIAAEKNAYYLMLFSSIEHGAKMLNSLWICNRHQTPDEMDLRGLEKGEGPILGKENVSEMQPQYGMEFNPDKFSAVWYDTGDAVAVFYGKKLICAIPPIVGLYDFPGFSIFAKGQTRYAWEMPTEPEFAQKIEQQRQFWEIIRREETWKKLEQDYIAVTDEFFGEPHTAVKPLGSEKFPNRSLVQGRKNKSVLYDITVGVSQYAMPTVAKAFGNDCADQSRIELAFACYDKFSPLIDLMAIVMKSIADIPWSERSFLWHGHTIDFPNIKGFSALLLVDPTTIFGMEEPKWRKFGGGRVNTLWIVPISEAELEFIRMKGIDELMERCTYQRYLHIFDNTPKFLGF